MLMYEYLKEIGLRSDHRGRFPLGDSGLFLKQLKTGGYGLFNPRRHKQSPIREIGDLDTLKMTINLLAKPCTGLT